MELPPCDASHHLGMATSDRSSALEQSQTTWAPAPWARGSRGHCRLARENPRWGYLRIVGEMKSSEFWSRPPGYAGCYVATAWTGPSTVRTQLERVHPSPGQDHACLRLLPHRYGLWTALLRPIRNRGRNSGGAPSRSHDEPQRCLDGPSGTQLGLRSPRGRPAGPILRPGP